MWLNLTLLLLAVTLGLVAQVHRQRIDSRFAEAIQEKQTSPLEVNRMKDELAEMDLTREQLAEALQGRLQYVESLRSEDFYIAIDTTARALLFRYGDKVLREAPVEIGEPATLRSPSGASWTFVPLKGAFRVENKLDGLAWQIPEWLYVRNGEQIPGHRPRIRNALGRYVIELPNDYVIHSPPTEGSPLDGPKPGSFMVPEEDLRAIWPRVQKGTRVFIF